LIRQTIACDICGAERRETNHWFVAVVQNKELCISNWDNQRRTTKGSKHLCGQTCLHRLVDDFMAGTVGGRPATEPERAGAVGEPSYGEAAGEGLEDFESSARLIPTPPARPARPTVAARAQHAEPRPLAVPAQPIPMAPRIVPPPPPPLSPKPAAQAGMALSSPETTALAASILGELSAQRQRSAAWERERSREAIDDKPLSRAAGRHRNF
jgi:hypothetical protein